MTDWPQLYREHVSAVTALVSHLDDDQVETVVPGTPAWTVHEVVAHLAGGPADSLTGRTDGAPGPEWTARHVGERLGLPVDVLLEELASHTDSVTDTLVDEPQPGVVWDIATHHADLHEALGRGELPEQMWLPVLQSLAPRVTSGLTARVECGGTTYGAGGPDDPVVTVAPYELFRAIFSRRSRGQMQEWGAALGDEQLDALCVFGPRLDDQPVP